MDTGDTITQLGEVLAQLESTPQSLALIKRQISLTEKLDMLSEAIVAISSLSQLVMLDTAMWLHYFDISLKAPQKMSLDEFVDALEKFDAAEKDYLSLEILRRHIAFIISVRQAIETSEVEADIAEFLSQESARQLVQEAVRKGEGLLHGSEVIWRAWLDWELSLPLDLDRLHRMFLDRLATPHLTSDDTSSLYSTFCSEHCPGEYEARMVQATQASQPARQKMIGEKRYGKTREDLEQELISAGDIASKLSVFGFYVRWETDERAKNPRSQKAPTSDPSLIRAIFERYVAYLAELARENAEETEYYKSAEAIIWAQYLEAENNPLSFQRATRACPQSAKLWQSLLQSKELHGLSLEEIDATFQQALAFNIVQQGTPLAELFLAAISATRRLGKDGSLDILYRGLNSVTGDQSFLLEKFAVEWGETQDEGLDAILTLLGRANKARLSSYQVTLLRAGAESRRDLPDAARAIYQTAIQRSDLDWPEAVYEAYLRFENLHGDLQQLVDARKRVHKEEEKLVKRREKASQEQMAAYTQAYENPEPADSGLQPEPEPDVKPEGPKRDREHTQVLVTGLHVGTEVGQVESFFNDCGIIREVTMLRGDDSDAALVEFRNVDSVPAALARDRRTIDKSEISVTMLWRSTLWVTNIAKNTDDSALRKLFTPYGRVLHTRWPSRKYGDTRRFCYVTMESPAAAEASLQLGGTKNSEGFGFVVKISDPSAKTARTDAATLFVGGLSAATTEDDVRELFAQHGTVKRVRLRWDPIKNSHKGFAFVDMESEGEMNAALSLNGSAFNGRILRVSQSDPNHAKKKQPEAQSGLDKKTRTVRLHNLPPTAQEGLLQQALEKIVAVHRLEMFTKTHDAVVELASAADAGKLLLSKEPFVFDGAVIPITEPERGKRPEAANEALGFAPRNARKPKAIGKGRTAPAVDKKLPPAFIAASSHGQDDFRQMIAVKNKQREGNLAEAIGEKRKMDGGEPSAKRGRVD